MEHQLVITWGTSRGADTYGYTVASLRDQSGKLRARCKGGGYDMRGTVFGDWLASEYQSDLLKIAAQANASYSKAAGYKTVTDSRGHNDGLYGMCHNRDTNKVSIDGACGFDSVRRIAEAINLDVRLVNAGGGRDVIIVTDTRAEAA